MIPFPFQAGQLGRRRASSPGGAGGDPNFASVSLLLHMDGSDASTTFTDSSASPKTVTTVGNAQIDTAQFKFGGASGLFDGTGDGLLVPSGADFEFGSGDFTVEGFVRTAGVSAFQGIVGKRANSGASPYGPFVFGIENSTGKLAWFSSTTGSSWALVLLATSGLTLNTWQHFAFVRNGTTARIFMDGVQVGSGTLTGTLVVNASSVSVGSSAADSSLSMNGWLDEIRVTKGVARYTADFTPPSTAFPDS